MWRVCLGVCAFCTMLCFGAVAQTAPPAAEATAQNEAAVLPERDSPTVIYAFLDFSFAWIEEIAKRKATNPAGGQALEDVALRLFQVSPADLAKLATVTRSVDSQFRALNRDTASYRDNLERARRGPDLATLEQFETRWRTILTTAMVSLRTQLSPAGYLGVQTYMNDTLRSRIVGIPMR